MALRRRARSAELGRPLGALFALIWRVLMVAERKFRRLNAHELLGAGLSGAEFVNGHQLTQVSRKAA